jgi:dihydroflavonol-4-reductase
MVLITGATGLLGSCVLRKFLEAGEEIVALKRKDSFPVTSVDFVDKLKWIEGDILDLDLLTTAFKGIDTVVHSAAMVSFNPKDNDRLFETNVVGTANVVNACIANDARLIHVSSVAALGRQKGINTIDESATWIDGPLNSSYGKSKYLAELEVYRGMEEGLRATLVCPSFILASSDWQRSSAQLFKYVWNEKRFYSSGLANYVDVEDVAHILFELYRRTDLHGQRYIACAGAIHFQDLFRLIAMRFNKRAPTIEIGHSVLHVLALIEEVKSTITCSSPLITRESVKSASEKFVYSNRKSIQELGITYQSLEETLNRCCKHYMGVYSTNK